MRFVQLAAIAGAMGMASLVGGCSGPTLEEACLDYCDAAANADCGQPTAEQCEAQCGQVEEQLDGQCEEEYTEVFECTADTEFQCQDGYAVPTTADCAEEAFELIDCLNLLEDDDSVSVSDG